MVPVVITTYRTKMTVGSVITCQQWRQLGLPEKPQEPSQNSDLLETLPNKPSTVPGKRPQQSKQVRNQLCMPAGIFLILVTEMLMYFSEQKLFKNRTLGCCCCCYGCCCYCLYLV